MNFIHRRQQWSVGHGFFHTATIDIERYLYRYIYDCGAQQGRVIEREIDRYEKNVDLEGSGKEIDMLVISHFHADHIKGIPELLKRFKIKHLVIPYLSEEAKSLVLAYLAAIGVEEWIVFSSLILTPEVWLTDLGSDAQLVQISAENGNSSDEASIPRAGNGLSIGIGISNQSTPSAIFLDGVPIWRFKFHVEDNSQYVAAIVKEIATELALNEAQLKACLRDNKWINANWETLKKCFTSIGTAKQNATNLSMFSGPIKDIYVARATFQPNERNLGCRCCMRDGIGWLGTGDANLKTSKAYTAFESSFNNYLSQIDTVTIPHHGSKHDYNAKIGDLCIRYVITSNHLIDPKDKHPASEVLVNLRSKGAAIDIVTDDPSTTQFDSFFGFLNCKNYVTVR
ncbi:metallo-beta-lactamase superfamily protein [Jezberella montanilacus]|uniref:Metallo-beta-lactamase superfamily protein n=1 Tax=Jezberella montanilacus TaxID=323426 RepID=A0A2T0XQ86_9BURK|nr:MBL fold metallo-hydrolase [Jezberella montanilacus]PRZ01086.1 metallo-beta-lactamase superfamily protein [Jezberella montanilacus]